MLVESLETRRLFAQLPLYTTYRDSIGVGQTDTHTFTAEAGAPVLLTLNADGVFNPRLDVFGPGGTLVAADAVPDASSGGAAVVEFTAPEAGTYTVNVSDTGNNNGGLSILYKLRFTTFPTTPAGFPANGAVGQDNLDGDGGRLIINSPSGALNIDD